MKTKKIIVTVVIVLLIPIILAIFNFSKNVYNDVQESVNEGAAAIIAYDLAGATFVGPWANSLSEGAVLTIEEIVAQAKMLEKDAGGYSDVTMKYFPDGNIQAVMSTGEIGYACVKLEGFGKGKCDVAKLYQTKQ